MAWAERTREWLRGRMARVGFGGAVFFILVGVLGWGAFHTGMEATNTLGFCISCHEMEDTVYEEYRKTIHYQNRTGVRATCSDCHVPDPWIYKVIRKIQASKELYHKLMGSIDTPNKFEAKRLELAKRVWASMKATDSRECRNCHNFNSMDKAKQKRRAMKQHQFAVAERMTCIDCHKGIAHKPVHKQLEDAEDLEDEEDVEETTEPATAPAVVAEVAKPQPEAPTAEAPKETPAPTAGAAAPGGDGAIDWTQVAAVDVALFYPGQSSYEWVLKGSDHSGARAYKKGERCADCHKREEQAIGAKIVSGEKLEPKPIPGKRGDIVAKVQTAHDGDRFHVRIQFPDTPHAPVPFFEGGKMDPDNQVKVAMMIAGAGVKDVERSGCWVTCHHDSRYMPDAPKPDAIAAAGDVAQRLDLSDGVTKYIGDSRTKIEVRGRGGKPRGGWNRLKPKEEIDAALAGNTYMELLRYRSGSKDTAQRGHILEQRHNTGGGDFSAKGGLADGTWTVTMSRPLAASAPGDIALTPGQTYLVGIAIHDDYSIARYHHVSLEYRMALDDPAAEINVVKK